MWYIFLLQLKYVIFDVITCLSSLPHKLISFHLASVGKVLHHWGHGFESRSSLNYFPALFCNCLSCIDNCKSDLSYSTGTSSSSSLIESCRTHTCFIFIIYRLIANSQIDQPQVGFNAWLIEHSCTSIAEIVGLNPI